MSRKCSVHGLELSKCGCIGDFEPTLTKQAFKEECDINEILKRAANGQDLSGSISSRVAQYGDFTQFPDFHESMNVVARAQEAFMELPWQVRERFANDPGKFVEFCQDEKNYDEAVKLGLLDAKSVEARRAEKAKAAEAAAAAGVAGK